MHGALLHEARAGASGAIGTGGGFVGLVWGRDRRARCEALRVFVDGGLIEVPVVFMRLPAERLLARGADRGSASR